MHGQHRIVALPHRQKQPFRPHGGAHAVALRDVQSRGCPGGHHAKSISRRFDVDRLPVAVKHQHRRLVEDIAHGWDYLVLETRHLVNQFDLSKASLRIHSRESLHIPGLRETAFSTLAKNTKITLLPRAGGEVDGIQSGLGQCSRVLEFAGGIRHLPGQATRLGIAHTGRQEHQIDQMIGELRRMGGRDNDPHRHRLPLPSHQAIKAACPCSSRTMFIGSSKTFSFRAVS